jgi:hypothetical protein
VKVRIERIEHCANVQCTNRASEGTMTVVTFPVSQLPIEAPRDIKLVMCAPCATYLSRHINH